MLTHKVGDMVMWFDRTLSKEERVYDIGYIKRIEKDIEFNDTSYVVEWITKYIEEASDEYSYSEMSIDAFKEDLASYLYEQQSQSR
jgi:hypothetical protein